MKHGHRCLRDVAVGRRSRIPPRLKLVESTTIEELESTARTESAGVVAEEIIRDSMMREKKILKRV